MSAKCFQFGAWLSFRFLHSKQIKLLISNSLLNNKILDQSKLKAFADGKVNAAQKLKFCLRM